MKVPHGWTRISEHEACSVYGGRSDQVGKIFEQIAAGVGMIIKFFWNLIQGIKKNFSPPETSFM